MWNCVENRWSCDDCALGATLCEAGAERRELRIKLGELPFERRRRFSPFALGLGVANGPL